MSATGAMGTPAGLQPPGRTAPSAEGGHLAAVTTAREAGLVGCRRCTRVWPAGRGRCGRCGGPLSPRRAASLQRVWAWWFAGVIAYIPANTLPMLRTSLFFDRHDANIVGGAVELMAEGAWFVGGIVLFASVGIPVAKFIAIAWLAVAVHIGRRGNHHRRQQLYEVVEFIGRWSMIDVFVVAILAALVQINVLATIRPGPAAVAFALSVVFTMLSARAFDPRLIWDRSPEAIPRADLSAAPRAAP